MNIPYRYQRLRELEIELGIVLKKDKKNWLKIAKVLMTIEEERLFELKHPSFTQYVHELAKDNMVNVSTLWRAKTAAKTYMEIAQVHDLHQVGAHDIQTTPEQLETFKKIQSIVPEQLVADLKERVLKGEPIRQELHEIWAVYRPLKRGKTERGRKKKEGRAEAVPVPVFEKLAFLEEDPADPFVQVIRDSEKMNRFHLTTEDYQITHIKNALRDKDWLHGQYGVLPKAMTMYTDCTIRRGPARNVKFDVVLVCPSSKLGRHTPDILGINIASNASKLEMLLERPIEQPQYCHFFFIALADASLLQVAQSGTIAAQGWGLLGKGQLKPDSKHEVLLHQSAAYHEINPFELGKVYGTLLEKSLAW